MFRSSQTQGLEGSEWQLQHQDLSLLIKSQVNLSLARRDGLWCCSPVVRGSCKADAALSPQSLGQGCVGRKGQHVL